MIRALTSSRSGQKVAKKDSDPVSEAPAASPPAASEPTQTKRGSSHGKLAEGEAEAINQLLKQSTGGADMRVVRERRRSKSKESMDLPPDVTDLEEDEGSFKKSNAYIREGWVNNDEAASINALIKEASTIGQGVVLRTRRKSKEKPNDRVHLPLASPKISPRADAPAAAPAVAAAPCAAPAAVAKQPSKSPSKWAKLREVPAGDLVAHLQRFNENANDKNIKGAAARGKKAAELARVKASVAEIGGRFLSVEEFDTMQAERTAMQAELHALRTANRKLMEEVVVLRKVGKAASPLEQRAAHLHNSPQASPLGLHSA